MRAQFQPEVNNEVENTRDQPGTSFSLVNGKRAHSNNEILLEARGLDVQFETSNGIAHVLNDMGFVCQKDQMTGLVGESGSGKTVLSEVLVNFIHRPGKIVSGQVIYHGRDLLRLTPEELQPIRGRQIGAIVAKSQIALNPLICVGDQIANIYQSHFEVTKQQARERVLEAIAATGINDPKARYSSYPHELSGGMAKRIIIAAALICEPTFIIADEPTSGLDVTIQAQVLDNMMDLISQKKTEGTLLMTRDLGIIAQYCNRLLITYAGQVIEEASVESFFSEPFHPYSKLLLASARLEPLAARAYAKMGPPPDKFNLPKGCLFQARCILAEQICCTERQQLLQIAPGRLVRCWKWEEL